MMSVPVVVDKVYEGTGKYVKYAKEQEKFESYLETIKREIEKNENDKIVRIVLLQIAHAVHNLHEQNMYHGEVTMSNLCISKSKKKVYLMRPHHSTGMTKDNQREDIRQLGILYEELLDETTCNDNIAEHLCKRMKSVQLECNSNDVLRHPYFWSTYSKLRFLAAVAQPCRKNDSDHEYYRKILKYSQGVFSTKEGWFTKLDITNEEERRRCNESLQKRLAGSGKKAGKIPSNIVKKKSTDNQYEKYENRHLWSLLIFIRDRFEHYRDAGLEVQACFSLDRFDGLWQFFMRRFPNLLPAVYDSVRRDENLMEEKYYKSTFGTMAPNEDLPTIMSEFQKYFASVKDEETVRIILLQIAYSVHCVHQKGCSFGKINKEDLKKYTKKIGLPEPNKKKRTLSEERTKNENIGMRYDVACLGKIFKDFLEEKDFVDNFAEHLCKRMRTPDDRKDKDKDGTSFTSQEVLQHPYFWNTNEKLEFLARAAQHITKEREDQKNDFHRRLERSETVFNARNGWFTELAMTDDTLDECKKRLQNRPNAENAEVSYDTVVKLAEDPKNGEYDKKHLWSLVQFVGYHWRNYDNTDVQVQACFSFDSVEGYWQFFNQRYFNLIPVVYDAVSDFYKHSHAQDNSGFTSSFEGYFENLAPYKDLPEIKPTEDIAL